MGKFEEAYNALNRAQRQAVDTIDGPVLVIAGPGTGKTQLLSLRVANILRKTDVNPESILCLTYTESGQRSMQSRLLEVIGEQARRIEVHTFHGFGTHLITRYLEYFPDLGGYRAADDLALYEVLESCFESLPYDSPLAKRAFGQWTYLQDAAERISQCKQAGLTPIEVIDRVRADADWCESRGSQIAKAFHEHGRLSGKRVPELAASLAGALNDPLQTGSLGEACVNSLKQALAESAQTGKASGLSAWKRAWFASEDGELYFKPGDQLEKLKSFGEVYKCYERVLAERKLFDYDDMILFSLKALESNAELRALCQETFQYILADEYQDTNPAQARIIELIADNPVNEGRPNVMVVGDDDQAIYGFQGAMGDVMLYFRERWRNVTTITLTENYRSTQDILDLARSVITRGEKRLENYYQDIKKILRANASHKAPAPHRAVAPTPADTLHYLVNLAKDVPKTEELAIIASKHRYLEEVAEAFAREEIPFFYEGRDDLLHDSDVSLLLLFADAALCVKQMRFARLDFVLPELFTYGHLGVKRPDAWALARAASEHEQPWWQVMGSSSEPVWRDAVSALLALARDLDTEEALASLQSVRKHVLPKRHGTAILDQKLTALVSHASAYGQRENVSLDELLRYVNRCRDAGIRLDARLETGQRGAHIKLMSAHKSKGQEFESVYLLHADEHTWFFEKGRRNNLVLPINWQYLQPATETFDDRLRILYVVLTRAKKHLRLFSSGLDRRGKPALPLPGTEVLADQQVNALTRIEPEPAQELLPWEAWYAPQSDAEKEKLKLLLKPKLSRYRLSPSHLTSFLDISRGGPVHFLIYTLLGVPHQVPPEAVFGSRVHSALHFMQNRLNETGSLPLAGELEAYVTDLLGEAAVADDIRRITETVLSFQAATRSLKPGGTAEYGFSAQNLKLGAVPVTGTVDRFDSNDKSLKIIDYKTGRPLKSWSTGDDYQKQKLHRFRQQLLFYELLFRLSPLFSEITDIRSRLEFVEPTKRRTYHALDLEADAPERAELEALIISVWRHIVNLDLPDTSAYEASARGVKQFEQDLLSEVI